MNPFVYENSKFWENVAVNLGHHGNVNVDVVVTTSLKYSQMKSISQSGEEPYFEFMDIPWISHYYCSKNFWIP